MTPKLFAAIAVLSLLTGCAATGGIELEQDHMSSASQHLRANPTNIGTNATMLYIHIAPTSHTYVDLGEGVSYGASFVPHHPEIFQGRAGVYFPLF